MRETYAQIKKDYIDTGKIRYATLDMPLESIHKLAFKAAEATHCAEDQGKFWEMSHRLFEQQRVLEPWKAHAEALGLDVAKFEACMASGRHAPAIRKDMASTIRALKPEQLQLTGCHNKKGIQTLEQVIKTATNHIPHHLTFVAEKRKALGV